MSQVIECKNGGYIVVVDDKKDIVNLLGIIIQSEGHGLLECNDPREALQVIKERKPCGLITDQMMPGMKGTELIRLGRDRYPQLPALLITGTPRDVDVLEVTDSKITRVMTRIIRKPFELDEVIRCVGLLKNNAPCADVLRRLKMSQIGY